MEREKLKRKIILQAWYLILFILLIHLAALYFSWYFTVWWFDIFMHLLGGAFAFLIAYRLYLFWPQINKFLFLFGGVFFIAIVWEIFEYLVYRQTNLFNLISFSDSLKDIFFGLIGAIGCYFYLRYINKELWPKLK